MNARYLYKVKFKQSENILKEFDGAEQCEIWTAETLAHRLLDMHYHIFQAVGVVVDDAEQIAQAERIDRQRRA